VTILVIPTYNEAGNILSLLGKIEQNMAGDYKLIFVDDNSSDGTIEEIRKAQADSKVELIVRGGRRGLGASLKDGLEAALDRGADKVVTMDADLSHDPAALPALLAAGERADVVLGSRYVAGGRPGPNFYRVALSRLANNLSRWLLGLPAHDLTTNYRYYNSAALKAVDLRSIKSDDYNFLLELVVELSRIGKTITEIPIDFKKRRYGSSKFSLGQIIRSALTVARLHLKYGSNDKT